MMMGAAPLGAMPMPAAGVVTAGAHATLAFLSQSPGAWRGHVRRRHRNLTYSAPSGLCIRQNVNLLGALSRVS
jgi:hypothetical protein